MYEGVLHVASCKNVAVLRKVVTMKLLPVLTLLSAFFLGGCNAAMWGNLAVLALTVGIFVGTLGLGRTADSGRSRADASTSTSRL